MAKRKKSFPGSIDRRGNRFRIRFSVDNEKFTFAVPTTDRRIAEIAATNKYAEVQRIRERRAAGIPDAVQMSTVIKEFEAKPRVEGTQRSYGDSLKPISTYFVEKLGDPSIEKVRASHIEAYLDWRRDNRLAGNHKKPKGSVSPRTLNKDRAVLHGIFALAERREYIAGNPVKRTDALRVDKHEPIILDDDEYERLLKACASSPMLSLYVLVLGETGMRCDSEALHLRFEDVNLEGRYVRVVSGREGHRTKTGQSREIRMSARLVSAMRDYFAGNRLGALSPYIFHSGDARLMRLRRSFKSAAKRAKLSAAFRQHDLRHRWVTLRANAGEPITDVQYEAGHAQIATTMLYYKQTPVHLRRPLTDTTVSADLPSRLVAQ